MQGLEDVLAKEVESIGGSKIQKLTRAVMYDGSRYTLYASNLLLSTALRIIVPVHESIINNENDLYNDVYDFPWEDYFDLEDTFAITATTSSKVFTHSQYVALKSKDAIVDRFRKLKGDRPNIDVEEPDFLINIHIRNDILTISLDSSGGSLHKRGYRVKTVPAPLNEVLAAGLIKLTEWDGNVPFLDAMCGSGTLLAESYFFANGIPTQMMDRPFAFKRWKDFDEKLWDRMVETEIPKLPSFDAEIIGRDASRQACDVAEANLYEIDMDNDIRIEKMDFFTSDPPADEGVLVINPPYDIRLRESDIKAYYKKIGDTLKKKYMGWQAFIFSGNIEAIKCVGLRPSRRFSLMNGAIPAKFHKFELYEGTKKQK